MAFKIGNLTSRNFIMKLIELVCGCFFVRKCATSRKCFSGVWSYCASCVSPRQLWRHDHLGLGARVGAKSPPCQSPGYWITQTLLEHQPSTQRGQKTTWFWDFSSVLATFSSPWSCWWDLHWATQMNTGLVCPDFAIWPFSSSDVPLQHLWLSSPPECRISWNRCSQRGRGKWSHSQFQKIMDLTDVH